MIPLSSHTEPDRIDVAKVVEFYHHTDLMACRKHFLMSDKFYYQEGDKEVEHVEATACCVITLIYFAADNLATDHMIVYESNLGKFKCERTFCMVVADRIGARRDYFLGLKDGWDLGEPLPFLGDNQAYNEGWEDGAKAWHACVRSFLDCDSADDFFVPIGDATKDLPSPILIGKRPQPRIDRQTMLE